MAHARDIADATGHARSSKNRIVRAYRTEGRLENLPRSHRPRVTNDSDDERIVAAARQDPKLTAKAIRNDLRLAASTQVIRERLHSAGLRSRVAAQKPLFSAQIRSRRLVFAREHQTWTAEEWRSVIFTDESMFNKRDSTNSSNVWRTENTSSARSDRAPVPVPPFEPGIHAAITHRDLTPAAPVCQPFVAGTDGPKSGTAQLRVASSRRCGVSVWGAISKDGLGPLVRLDGRFNAATYKVLLDTVMLPYALDEGGVMRETLTQMCDVWRRIDFVNRFPSLGPPKTVQRLAPVFPFSSQQSTSTHTASQRGKRSTMSAHWMKRRLPPMARDHIVVAPGCSSVEKAATLLPSGERTPPTRVAADKRALSR
ncbi:hypothetical protein HPB48_004189 [Haemaphysalis longicornis]|uniref:Transposase Tc1-like domain-containing protein n=1 Tax=Haemaphysalis longicornis TaxID=44386 RepID=A0A9J6GL94_HAELO|nr:hypothetical protein HPB48_004189 [Haemaphysalis longicornis]